MQRCRSVLLAALLCWATTAQPEPFNFVVLGDLPYGTSADVTNSYASLIDIINARAPSLVIHVGDIKSGGDRCTDDALNAQLDNMNRFAAPMLYTPGDNEWTDCHRQSNGSYDPSERLAYIRDTFFADPSTTLGTPPAPVVHQGDAGLPENARLMIADIMFVTAHMVGSNNNFEADRPEAATEFARRNTANRAWLAESFAAAQDAKALVLAIHADMFREGYEQTRRGARFERHSGFRGFARTLTEEAAAFGKPILLLHGDSHRFSAFRPFAAEAPNILALETFGAGDVHAIEIHVTPDDTFPFAIQPLLNPLQPQ